MQYGFAKRSRKRRWQNNNNNNNNKKTELRKNSIFGKLIENYMKECSHLDQPFKEKTNFVIKQLVLKRIM